MRDIRLAAAQFEAVDGNKAKNLATMRQLTQQAAAAGAEVVSFHEICVTGYSYLQDATRDELLQVPVSTAVLNMFIE